MRPFKCDEVVLLDYRMVLAFNWVHIIVEILEQEFAGGLEILEGFLHLLVLGLDLAELKNTLGGEKVFISSHQFDEV